MTDSGKAVFLSYASQDAEAAKRICDALRAAGVEVWFDQSELRGGDAWDQSIRRQIKECALFVPIISAATNARAEGYFRLEWKLAVDRSHLMADDQPFLFPVVIDDTPDATARVPDKFRDVQWTRLRLDETPGELAGRVARLLSGDVGRDLRRRLGGDGEAIPPDRAKAGFGDPALHKTRWQWWMIFPTVGVIMGLMFAAAPLWQASRRAEPKPAAVAPAAPLSEADQFIARAYALCSHLNYSRDNLAIAEDLTRKATELASDSARAWGARAFVNSCYLLRGWDTGDRRREDTQTFARRALALDANEVDAMLALAVLLNQQRAYAQAEAMARRGIALRADDYRLRSALIAAVGSQGRDAESFALAEDNVRRFPREPLTHYSLANGYRLRGQFDEAIASYDAALALQPFAGALLYKTILLVTSRGDVPAARATLEQVVPVDRGEDRAVGVALWLSLVERQPARVHEAATLTARAYFEDSVTPGPKAWSVALAYQLEGKETLARRQWQAAEEVLRQRLRDHPEAADDRARLATTLVWLGRADEAAREIAPFEAGAREQPSPRSAYLLAQYYAAQGNAAQAAPQLSRAMNRHTFVTAHILRLDPQWDKLRGSPEFIALLAAPAVETAAALSPARELVEKARALVQGLEATREDFALAEDYCQRALKLDSTDAEVWSAYAQLHSAFGYRGWDTSPERREQNRVMAERAIRLAPKSVQARLAQAGAWTAFGINRTETEKLLRDVVQEQPDDQAALRFLAVTVLNRGGLEECLALNERSAALPGGDPLALFNNARYLWQRGRQDEAYAIMQRSIAQKPFSSALALKAFMEIIWRGDPTAAEATLRQIPQSEMLEDRANYTAGLVHYYQRRADAAFAAWGAFPRDYYADFAFDGPKGLLVGLAHELDHRDAAARIEWRTALQVVEKRLAAAPNKPAPYYHQAYLLACLGEKAAAGEALRTYEQLAGIKPTPESPMTIDLAFVYARLGRFDDIFAQSPSRFFRRIRIDPRFDGLRSDPRYVYLLAEFQRQNPEPKK